MALSSVTYPSVDGSTNQFAVTFAYLQQAHVQVYVDGVEDTTFTWPDAATIQTTDAAGTLAGKDIVITRTTPRDERIVNFQDASVVTEALLDGDGDQLLFMVQEIVDDAVNSIQLDTVDGEYDADNRNIKQVATPTDAFDAANKGYVDTILASGGVLPTPANPGDNDAHVGAQGGVYLLRTPAQVRTSLGFSSDASAFVQAANNAAMWDLLTKTTTAGDIIYRGASADERLALGSADMALVAASAAPAYVKGLWVEVARYTANADALIEFFHDGIDNAGVDLVDGYSYRVRFQQVYPSSAGSNLVFQLYELGAYRTQGYGYRDFRASASDGGVVSTNANTAVFGYAGRNGIAANQASGSTGWIEFNHLASSTRESSWRAYGAGTGASGTDASLLSGNVVSSVTLRPSTKLKMYASTGDISGIFILERKRDS